MRLFFAWLRRRAPSSSVELGYRMLKRRRVAAFLFILGSILSSSSGLAFADSIPDEQWVTTTPTDVRTTPYLGINADGEGTGSGMGTSWLLGQEADGNTKDVSNITAHHICKSVNDPSCAKSKVFQYAATFDRCNATLTVDCVSSIEATSASGKKLEVKYLASLASVGSIPFEGSPDKGIPTGGSAQIVDIPEAPHPGGTQYLVAVHSNGSYTVGADKAGVVSFYVRISAIKMTSGLPAGTDMKGLIDLSETVRPGLKLGKEIVPNDALPKSCLVYSQKEDVCASPFQMPLDVNFKVSLKTSINVQGWFHGRVSKASSTFSVDKDNIASITFSGNPVVVPTFSVWYKKADLPAKIAAYNSASKKPLSGRQYGGNSSGSAISTDYISLLRIPHDFVQDEIDELNVWMAASGDKAAASPTRWIFQSIAVSADPNAGRATDNQSQPAGGQQPPAGGQQPPAGGQSGGQKVPPEIACYKNYAGKFLGVVSTNATQYISGPPTYDAATETLDYKVAAPHYLADGSTFQGTYNLEINETLARCIYGFSDAPISATVSVIGVDGENKVATTLVSSSGGFLRLSASGFTFSNPIIKVKLTQKGTSTVSSAKPAAPSALAKPAPVALVKSITCAKGKLTKKVSGTAPKCPSGYSQKK